MSKQDVAMLMLRLLGVYYVTQSLFMAGGVVAPIRADGYALNSLLYFIISLILGVVLIAAARPLGRHVAGHSASPDHVDPLGFADWQAIVFSGIGVWLTVRGLLGGAQATVHFYDDPWDRLMWFYLALGLVQAAIGIALFLQARGLATLWRRFQDSGVPKQD